MPEELLAFLNILKIMQSIDRGELVLAGVLEADDLAGWKRFTDDPYTWSMKASDDKVNKLWTIVQARSVR